MTDRDLRSALADLAEHAPATLDRRVPRGRSWRAGALVASAAVAVVAVAVGATLLTTHSGRDEPAGAPVAAFVLRPVTEQDAPPPAELRHPTSSCVGTPLSASAEPSPTGGLIRVRGTGCALSGELTLRLADGRTVTPAEQPELPSPPDIDRGHRTGSAVVPFTVAGENPCAAGAPVSLLIGRTTLPVKGSRCGRGTGAAITLGQLHQEGSPSALVPSDRAELRASLSDVRTTITGPRFTVTLANPTLRSISLSPCPSYRVTRVTSSGAEEIVSQLGGLDCTSLPPALRPGQRVSFAGGYDTTDETDPPPATVSTSVTWAISGPAGVSSVVDPRIRPSDPTRPVVFGGLQVQVPATWTSDGASCGRPTSDTVYRQDAPVICADVATAGGPGTFSSLSYESSTRRPCVPGGGGPVLRCELSLREGSSRTGVTAMTEVVLVLPGRDTLIRITSPNPVVARGLADTARATGQPDNVV